MILLSYLAGSVSITLEYLGCLAQDHLGDCVKTRHHPLSNYDGLQADCSVDYSLLKYAIRYTSPTPRSLPYISAVANPSSMNDGITLQSSLSKTGTRLLAELRQIVTSSIPKAMLHFFDIVVNLLIQLIGGEAWKHLNQGLYFAGTGIHSFLGETRKPPSLTRADQSKTINRAPHHPRVPPGLPPLPGPYPENIGVSFVDTVIIGVAHRAIQRLLSRVWTLIFEQSHRDPNGILPEDGFRLDTSGYYFSILPRDGVFMTWTVVCEAFQLIEALQSAGGYGTARINVHNGERIIAVAYVDKS